MNLFTENSQKEESGIFFFKKIYQINFVIPFCIVIISLIGISVLWGSLGAKKTIAYKQISYMLTFSCLMLIIVSVNVKILKKLSLAAYLASVFLLLYVQVFGMTAMGATRWIDLKFIKLQPSEIAKIAIILQISSIYSQNKQRPWVALFKSIFCIMVPFSLIVLQPDLATSLICLMIGLSICFLGGMNSKIIFLGIAAFAMSGPVAWKFMHDYQKDRVINFMNPENDPLGSGYNIIQSKIAIGSGGLLGKGVSNGSQSQLDFLPERRTDFIFTVLCEELGFFFSFITVILYSILIIKGFLISIKQRDLFLRLLAGGGSFYFFINAFINMMMTSGMLPVAGVPLPLMSYGGSSVASSLICCGLILNADVNTRKSVL